MKHLYIQLGFTFFVGFLGGVYFYFLGNTVEPKEITPYEEQYAFEVIADLYGGCTMSGCASYRVVSDGLYTYLSSEAKRSEGRLTSEELDALEQLLIDTDLGAVESSVSTYCASPFDGVDYRYEIRYEGESHFFDSCEQELRSEPLFTTLGNYFQIFYLNSLEDNE